MHVSAIQSNPLTFQLVDRKTHQIIPEGSPIADGTKVVVKIQNPNATEIKVTTLYASEDKRRMGLETFFVNPNGKFKCLRFTAKAANSPIALNIQQFSSSTIIQNRTIECIATQTASTNQTLPNVNTGTVEQRRPSQSTSLSIDAQQVVGSKRPYPAEKDSKVPIPSRQVRRKVEEGISGDPSIDNQFNSRRHLASQAIPQRPALIQPQMMPQQPALILPQMVPQQPALIQPQAIPQPFLHPQEMKVNIRLFDAINRTPIAMGDVIPEDTEVAVTLYLPENNTFRCLCEAKKSDETLIKRSVVNLNRTQGTVLTFTTPKYEPSSKVGNSVILDYRVFPLPAVPGTPIYGTRLFVNVCARKSQNEEINVKK